jgi:glutamate-1-semialdehyde 2,1-aminomutase
MINGYDRPKNTARYACTMISAATSQWVPWITDASLGWLVASLLALAWVIPRVHARLRLSLAKHPSLRGHPRIASRMARLVPYYGFDEDGLVASDGAPDEIAQQRKSGLRRLARTLQSKAPITIAESREIENSVSDVAFTSSYRVPFQFRALVRSQLPAGCFVTETRGVQVKDLDGNWSYDLGGSYGLNVFGYDFYKGCIERGAERVRALGPVLGAYHPVLVDNVRRLKQISGLDEVSFHMSGTEAVMQAVRLACYHTGRSHLVRFCGAYHGWWDDVQPGPGNPRPAKRTYTLRDMDERTLDVLRSRKDIACVLVNPLQALHPNSSAPTDSVLVTGARRAGFERQAYAKWLKRLRQVCTERGIVLVFDEVFLGFRLAPGGAQEYFGVQADLVTYGKTVGGGLPIGVLCGRAHLMRRFRDKRPSDICFARGTFNSHPYVMAAMNEFLRALDVPEVRASYAELDEVWNKRAAALNGRLASCGIPVRVANLASVWTTLYTTPGRFNWMFQYYLRANGLALAWVGSGRMIFSHTYDEADFEAVAERFLAAGRAMLEDGWWWRNEKLTERAIRRRLVREILAAAFGRNQEAGAAPTVPASPETLAACRSSDR